MCTAFSRLCALSAAKRDPRDIKRQYKRALLDKGLYFLHEHPALATSWSERCITDFLNHASVERITGDQCQLGQETDLGEPVKTPTGFMSNPRTVLQSLQNDALGLCG